MNHRFKTGLFLLILSLSAGVSGQTENYTVKKSPLSSDKFDEFCPVYYKGGIVFCSNRDIDAVNKYSDLRGKNFIKIFYTDTSAFMSWQDAKLFSKNLKTRMNDGPVSFSHDLSTVYFSRNIYAEGSSADMSSPRNKLGLFTSEFDGEWKKPHDFRYNNEWYNITAPCLSPDGSVLFFASDKPGGHGGSDLYYCLWEKDYWGDPVNMGPLVNSPGNESYPFMCRDGELFFSSDGHGGLGGKDIFYTRLIDSVWQKPVHLNAPINSRYDDFALITDPLMKNGYFSSNRDGTYDIFSFNTSNPQLFYSTEQRTNVYCYKFRGGVKLDIDPGSMQYEWTFGDSGKSAGDDAEHCFAGPGIYNIEENVTDRQTGRVLFTKQRLTLEIKDIEQPFISSAISAVAGEPVSFNADKSYLPDQKILDYYWDFGDGTLDTGKVTAHKFSNQGDDTVRLGLALQNIKTGATSLVSVYKVIKIFKDQSGMNSFVAYNSNIRKTVPDVDQYDHAVISNYYKALSDDAASFLYQVKVFSSRNHTDPASDIFRNLLSRYYVKEIYQPESDSYGYIVSEESDFISSVRILRNVISLGFKDAVIQSRALTIPEEKDLYNLRRVYGTSADLFFGRTDARLTSAGFTYFDQVVTFMNRYPDVKLLIESFTDKAGTSSADMLLSVQRAQAVANYIAGRGINSERLIARGYGDTRPFSVNSSEEEKKKDQRIELMIIR